MYFSNPANADEMATAADGPADGVRIALLFRQRSLQTLVLDALASAGLQGEPCADTPALLCALRHQTYDAVLLQDDEEHAPLCLAMLQAQGACGLPCIVVGTSGGDGVARALQHGASDYAGVVSDGAELLSRLQAQLLLRRSSAERARLEVAGYVLDARTQVVASGDGEVGLTGREFALAWALFANSGRTVSLPALGAQVWGRSAEVCKRTIEQHVYKLRRKLGAVGLAGVRIQAAYGVGYRLDIDEGRPAARASGVTPAYVSPGKLSVQ
ncbi:response regulator transcription factor [Aquabacterium sp. A7-Y]|uniref:winged helix-turn-helix transcriptional regulator n=1 Tax=Aquabacterium sp. A7-Y TaxID=1349605 RepID=UPI00223D843C|nr:response regulator transcription factor [Aquabacterium sp. A7-Y]MCW7541561.1 response regulator transcription factor [Aquabacterium sp. A7-Y]